MTIEWSGSPDRCHPLASCVLAALALAGACTARDAPRRPGARPEADSKVSVVAPGWSSRFQVEYGSKYHTVGGAPACSTPDDYAEFGRYRAVEDSAMMKTMIREGSCRWLAPGMTVVAEEFVGGEWNGDLIAVRVLGTRDTLVLAAP